MRPACASRNWSACKLFELSLNDGVVRVLGKGSKERLVPLGEVAAEWLTRYLARRPRRTAQGPASDSVFVTGRGGAA